VLGQIDKVMQFRNKLAHWLPGTSDEFLAKNYTDRIQLQDYDGRIIEITDTEIKEELSNCSRLVIELDGIRSEITQSKIT
jgi:hypothetical protein